MTSLEQIVLPLAESRALAEAGIKMDTALVWVGVWGINAHWHVESREQIEMIRSNSALDRLENGATFEDRGLVIVGAPTLSELLDAIRARNPVACVVNFSVMEKKCWHFFGEEKVIKAPTDLLAAYALLREVSHV